MDIDKKINSCEATLFAVVESYHGKEWTLLGHVGGSNQIEELFPQLPMGSPHRERRVVERNGRLVFWQSCGNCCHEDNGQRAVFVTQDNKEHYLGGFCSSTGIEADAQDHNLVGQGWWFKAPSMHHAVEGGERVEVWDGEVVVE